MKIGTQTALYQTMTEHSHHRKHIDGPTLLTAIAVVSIVTLAIVLALLHHPQPKTKTAAAASTKTQQSDATPKKAEAPVKAAVMTEKLPGADRDPAVLKPLGEDLSDYLDDYDPGSSIYIEDFTHHVAVNVGETKAYNIKSLMKVPLVMSLYKANELGRLNIDDKVTVNQKNIDKEFGDLWQKGAGYQLTLRQAAAMALQKSDNTAILLINDHVFKVMQPQERAYQVIPMNIHGNGTGDAFVSTSSYSTVFRCLLTSCYNTPEHSQEILTIMKHGIFRAPYKYLPATTEVSHKIGSVGKDGYNDCGIVYGPKSPFIYCIMLAQCQPQADQAIGDIVKRTYDFMEK